MLSFVFCSAGGLSGLTGNSDGISFCGDNPVMRWGEGGESLRGYFVRIANA